jgi:hypothetical protein
MSSPANNEAGRRVSTSTGAARWSLRCAVTKGSRIRLPHFTARSASCECRLVPRVDSAHDAKTGNRAAVSCGSGAQRGEGDEAGKQGAPGDYNW